MVGGEERKSKRPSVVADNTAFLSTSRPSQGIGHRAQSSSKNTNLKGLISFARRNVSMNVVSKSNRTGSVREMTTTNSKNTGDAIVERISKMVRRRGPGTSNSVVQSPISRVCSAFSCDRSSLSREMGKTEVRN